MADFKYKAVNIKTGEKKMGTMEAKSEKDLKEKLKTAGYVFLSSGKNTSKGKKTKNGKAKKEKPEKKAGLFSKVTLKEITIFSRQLATMISSGVTLLKAINILSEQNENPLFREILLQIKNDISSGISFSIALSKHPKQFDYLYVNMVKSGEASGALETVLDKLAEGLEKDQALRGKVKGAMMYPIIVMSVAFIIVAILLVAVVPTFTGMFEDAGMQLPGLTQAIVDVSHFLAGLGGLLVLIILIASIFGFKKFVTSEKGKIKWDRFVLKLPIMGEFTRKVAVGRFTRTMATLLNSGVAILTAFDIVTDVVGNEIISQALKSAKSSIKEGNTIAGPLRESGEFPTMVTQMIEIGEESGAITEMLGKVADFNEREVEDAIAALVAAMEPLAIVVMAVVVGTIVVGMFLPMFQLSEMAG